MDISVSRRRFLESAAAAGLSWSLPQYVFAAPFPVHFRSSHPYESLFQFVDPGHDEFVVEKEAAEITAHLDRLLQVRSLPLAADFQGLSPMPARYKTVAEHVSQAEFDPTDQRFEHGVKAWLSSLGQNRSARFFVLPQGRVRYEIEEEDEDEPSTPA